ncbi:MAG: hypothetical protein JO215_15435 [Ktedonobacteraceae bacterium]|nr:hypothetical protein [Ktedonobacteraceae bacterium]
MRKDCSTRADILQYASQVVMPIASRGHMQAKSAELLTSQQISKLLAGESTGFSKDHALWFVEVTGSFNFPGKGLSRRGYEVFDPSTGNLVMFGGMH